MKSIVEIKIVNAPSLLITITYHQTLDNILKTASSISEKGQEDQLESSGGT